MRIKSFKTDIYAGISDMEVSFHPGLNVVCGPNEAGKSTLVEAIHATLFRDHRLRMNRSKDREFHRRFIPHPDGSYINGALTFEIECQTYRIRKEWGSESSVELELPDGRLIRDGEKASSLLSELFKYGEATYGRVVFARQLEVKRAIERIVGNSRVAETVGSFLRKAVMELDGVSIDRLRDRIDEELEELIKRWDWENSRPENPNRDINNPYRIGCGRILKAHYRKEGLKREIRETRQVEDDFAELSGELKKLREKIRGIDEELEELGKLEGDIFRRGIIEPELKQLRDEYKRLRRVNSRWPGKEKELEYKERELEGLKKKIGELKKERDESRKAGEKKELKKKLDQICKIRQKSEQKEKELGELGEVSPERIDRLEALEKVITECRTAVKAATMIGTLNYAADQVFITPGMEKQRKAEVESEFMADGYLRVEIEDTLDLEIRSKDIDFEELEADYRAAREEFEHLLSRLGAEDLKEARQKGEHRRRLESEIGNLKEQLKTILDGRRPEELEARYRELSDYQSQRSPEEIERELEEIEISELMASVQNLQQELKKWREEYGDQDTLLEKLIEIKRRMSSLEEELEELHRVPERFESPDKFKKYLDNLRSDKKELEKEYTERREELFDIEKELPEVSSEELERVQADAEKEFEQLVSRAESLFTIKECFEHLLAQHQSDPFKPLVETFSSYLTRLTDHRYRVRNIEEGLEPEIENQNGVSVPLDTDFLSYGTYDGVALAFRFALLKQLFADRKGLVVLDDCLTNLDPERKRKAVELIRTASEDNQVIFTTCDPRTAEELGGRLIELE